MFALAFLFRLQAQLLGWGPLVNFLKVDILNVMGLALVMAGALWGLSTSRTVRIVLFTSGDVRLRHEHAADSRSRVGGYLPDPVEWYFRPSGGTPALFSFRGPDFCSPERLSVSSSMTFE